MGLKLQDVPAAAGLRWVTLAFSEYFQHALGYTSLFVAFLGGMLLTVLLPIVGGVLLMMAVPLLSLAFMMATHGSLHDRPLQIAVYARPWQQREPDRRRPLFSLLVAYAVLTAAVLWLCETIDGGAFDAWLVAFAKGDTPPEELAKLAEAPGTFAGALWRTVLTAALAVPFWFAPALVLWGRQGVAQALFTSALALWRAKAAFLVFGFGWMAVMVSAGMVASILVGLIGPAFAGLLVMPIGLILTSTFYVSLYFSFRDCFGEPD